MKAVSWGSWGLVNYNVIRFSMAYVLIRSTFGLKDRWPNLDRMMLIKLAWHMYWRCLARLPLSGIKAI